VTAQTIPVPDSLTHLRPTDRHGALVTGATLLATLGSGWLSLAGGPIAWITGQVALGGLLVVWFAILHECGHRTLFRSRTLNAAAGMVAGFLTIIPFHAWTRVHGRHHKWTGWQDLDPTTESLVPRPLRWTERTIVNICWRCWIPLFSTLYRVENFWNPRRIAALFPNARDRALIHRNALAQIAAYVALAAVAGPSATARVAVVAILISFAIEDLLLLSQHTHVPQNVSGGDVVPPVPAVEQEVFTRSLRLPRWVSAALLHIDAHELHHMFPFVPGYHLRRIAYQPAHEVGWWTWVRGSKRLAGTVLLFQNRRETGFPL
jgi:omega-6 fatty acid desaturase (delta-12 desaturase)